MTWWFWRILLFLIPFTLSLVPALLWYALVSRGDPHRRAKGHRYFLFFLGGIAAAWLAGPVYRFIFGQTGGFYSLYAAADDFFTGIFIVGPVEEGLKFLCFLVIARATGSIKEPRDGVLLAVLTALGFSFWENIAYISWGGPRSVFIRTIWATSAHVGLAAVWGYFTAWTLLESPAGRNWFVRNRLILSSLFTVMVVHGLHNFLGRWVGPGGALGIDLLLYIAALVVFSQSRPGPSGYKNWPYSCSAEAVEAIQGALVTDPDNIILRRRLGFYLLYLGREAEAREAWRRIPRGKEGVYHRAWLHVLASRERGRAGYRYGIGNLSTVLGEMSPSMRSLFKRRLGFFLKGDAGIWVKRIEAWERDHEEEELLTSMAERR